MNFISFTLQTNAFVSGLSDVCLQSKASESVTCNFDGLSVELHRWTINSFIFIASISGNQPTWVTILTSLLLQFRPMVAFCYSLFCYLLAFDLKTPPVTLEDKWKHLAVAPTGSASLTAVTRWRGCRWLPNPKVL